MANPLGKSDTSDYRRVMLGAYELTRGPATGVDFAREAYLFERTHRFIPPRDGEEMTIVHFLFREYLRTAGIFSQNYRRWLELRNDRKRILDIATIIPRGEASRCLRTHVSQLVATIYQSVLWIDLNVMKYIITGLRDVERSLAIGSAQHNGLDVAWSQFRQLAVDVVPLTASVNTMTAEVRRTYEDARRSLWSFIARPDVRADDPESLSVSGLDHEINAILHAMFCTTDGVSRLLFDASEIKSGGGRDAGERIAPLAERLSKAIGLWYDVYVFSVLGTTRIGLTNRMGEIDKTFLEPLHAIAQDMAEAEVGGDSSKKYLDELRKEMYHIRLEEVRSALQAEYKLCQNRLNQAQKSRSLPREHIPQISFVRHSMSTWMGHVNNDLQLIGRKLSQLSSADDLDSSAISELAGEIITLIGWVRESLEVAFTDISSQPALEFIRMHFHGRGAKVRIKGEDALPKGIDNDALRKILSLLVMDAIDFPRKGVPLEITITAKPESLAVADNGLGMTPRRLEEVREAMRTGRPLTSDHGGTGRGLINVAHYLTPLFPHSARPATMDIQSQFGAGTVFTINFPTGVLHK